MIGATASWSKDARACLPSAQDLAEHLARQATYPADEPEQLATVAQYFDVAVGTDGLRRELHEIFDHDYEVPHLHRFLAQTPASLLIVTTNYDDLLERAFREARRPFDLVVHTTDPKLGDQLLWWPDGASVPQRIAPKNLVHIDLSERSVIYKIHGTIDRSDAANDQYVISEDDYVDFLTRMTRGRAIPAGFAEAFQNRQFLFLGYGLRDWNLRVVLNRIEKDLRRPKGKRSWTIDAMPSALEARFWQERGVNTYRMTIDAFVAMLQRA